MTGLVRRQLGCVDYGESLNAMRQYTDQRERDSADEIWLLEHPPVFTQGQAGKDEHILARSSIPVVVSDRGGQVTYHGPGQLVAYVLLDLRRAGIGVRELVVKLEQAVIASLSEYGITALGRRDAPGVYVDGQKIAALGLRVRKGCTYHGVALNISPDLAPFSMINPCGWAGLKVTSMQQLGIDATMGAVGDTLFKQMNLRFG